MKMIEVPNEGARVWLHPLPNNPLHKSPVLATYSDGYFYCDWTEPMHGPDYYVGDVLTYIDRIEDAP